MGDNNLGDDLSQTITNAVKARVEAEVIKAFAGDEVMGRMVAAALQQTVEVKERYGGYNTRRIPFIQKVLEDVIQEAAKTAVVRIVAEDADSIEQEVRKALRRDVAKIATALTQNLVEVAGKPYGVNVDLTLRMPNT